MPYASPIEQLIAAHLAAEEGRCRPVPVVLGLAARAQTELDCMRQDREGCGDLLDQVKAECELQLPPKHSYVEAPAMVRAVLSDIRRQLKGSPDSLLTGEHGLAAATQRQAEQAEETPKQPPVAMERLRIATQALCYARSILGQFHGPDVRCAIETIDEALRHERSSHLEEWRFGTCCECGQVELDEVVGHGVGVAERMDSRAIDLWLGDAHLTIHADTPVRMWLVDRGEEARARLGADELPPGAPWPSSEIEPCTCGEEERDR